MSLEPSLGCSWLLIASERLLEGAPDHEAG